ncbi:hypothetical protein C5C18_13215 [Rathayibacter tritici]|uniref:Asp23/Gls24 family envelope stress response protein n=1 Tax=Rathayibacter tritici TaxID=33888 RepID=A0A160KQ91_9MICO|nr:hypothetical protein [Rathayibacter tritici]AND15686.1 hypothetical protein A6122_0528 [Rathayibacter tritici]PPF23682.1 hypothetical protein C5C06_13875 [Rathayibacter tritici]PPF64705.1 hypothetical protein C5C21_12005 [Rathayibacter tritici]PPG04730.1 hypothetical protein C5C18_13215 [Rathayibacter tritici]PPI16816.1 hypothetical protein C5D07_06125 [Rathayibacter tritici]
MSGLESASAADPVTALAAELRALDGVAALVPARPEVRDVLAHAAAVLSATGVVVGPLGTASGGTFAAPVLVRVAGEEVAVAVDFCVTDEASAPDVARAIGAVVREWCVREHPQLSPRVSVRVAAVD